VPVVAIIAQRVMPVRFDQAGVVTLGHA